ncbi:MAG: GTP-binding protein [Clostridia bacterium]|nr:GTP-binding protein [Clostridia bacterium]
MTKIDIFSGFLGAGKTTLIKKLISEVYAGEKLVLIENEFGDVGVDGAFLQDAGIEITEMSSGCICCSLVGDFGIALEKVISEFHPDRILIEPSGVGKLSDVILAVQRLGDEEIFLNSFTTVVDAKKAKMYMKNFGEFFNNQVEFANSIILSRTADMSENKIQEVIDLLRTHNTDATIITTPWDELDGKLILEAMEHKNTLEAELQRLAEEVEKEAEEHEKLHHHHDHDEEEHEHHHDHDEEEHEHHHHDHDEEEHEHHHHDHDEEEHEHHHHDHEGHHHHHHGHDADEIFESWGVETAKKFSRETIENALKALDNAEEYGIVLRAKGAVASEDGKWIFFDYVPEESNIRDGKPDVIGRLCVIGSELKEDNLKKLFNMD